VAFFDGARQASAEKGEFDSMHSIKLIPPTEQILIVKIEMPQTGHAVSMKRKADSAARLGPGGGYSSSAATAPTIRHSLSSLAADSQMNRGY
jgi:hypothetical protein